MTHVVGYLMAESLIAFLITSTVDGIYENIDKDFLKTSHEHESGGNQTKPLETITKSGFGQKSGNDKSKPLQTIATSATSDTPPIHTTLVIELGYDKQFPYPSNINALPLVRNLMNGTPAELLPVKPINLFTYPYLKNCHSKCLGMRDGPYILFLVKTALPNYERRSVIRRTWGDEKRFVAFDDLQIRTVFLVGTSAKKDLQINLDQEEATFGDIVQLDYLDTYNNLTFKTQSGMKWAFEHCQNASFVVVVDDDIYLSPINLIRFLNSPKTYPKPSLDTRENGKTEEMRLYAGYVLNNTKPIRDDASKWGVSSKDYPLDFYPPYVAGPTYVLSRLALYDLHFGSRYTKFFRYEDAFVGLIARKVGIQPTHSSYFHVANPTSFKNLISSDDHNDPKALEKLWDEQKKNGFC